MLINMFNKQKVLGVILLASTLITSALATNINGAGASFPSAIYYKWSIDYNKLTGKKVNYQSVGSSGGVKQIKANLVDFGASDKPVSQKDLDSINAIQFPTVSGAIVTIVNIKGIDTGKLVLSPEIIADIYLKKIKFWDDERIVTLNQDLDLPHLYITPLYRADGSGTTYNFSKFLSQSSEEFKNEIGVGNSVGWITGIGSKGNEGLSDLSRRVNGSISYIEYNFALQTNITPTKMFTHGHIVEANTESITNAIKSADWENSLQPNLLNIKADNAWPLVTTTFIIIRRDSKMKSSKEVFEFFDYGFKNDQSVKSLNYVPMPDTVINRIKLLWADFTKQIENNN